MTQIKEIFILWTITLLDINTLSIFSTHRLISKFVIMWSPNLKHYLVANFSNSWFVGKQRPYCSQLTSRGHHWALAACIRQVPPDWKRPAGRPSHTWLRATEADLGPLNFGLATAWRKASTRDEWRHIVDTATLQQSMLWKKKRSLWHHCQYTIFSILCLR